MLQSSSFSPESSASLTADLETPKPKSYRDHSRSRGGSKKWVLSTLKHYLFSLFRLPPAPPAPTSLNRERERHHVVRKRNNWVISCYYKLQTEIKWPICVVNVAKHDPIVPVSSSYTDPAPCHSNTKSYFHDFRGFVTWIWYFGKRLYFWKVLKCNWSQYMTSFNFKSTIVLWSDQSQQLWS